MRFVAVDVETANPNMASICQVGVVVFEHGREIAADVRLVNPSDYFSSLHVGIHGIDDEAVKEALAFSGIAPWLSGHIAGQIVVCHSHFDRTALTQASARHGVTMPPMRWLDSCRVARRTWPAFAQSHGYGLKSLAEVFGITFQHHDALEDARAAGQILHRAILESGIDLEAWLQRVEQPVSGPSSGSIRRSGAGDGPLVGQSIVFTGAMAIPRRVAADLAQAAGSAVEDSVTASTTILVVGDQDISRLAGANKSSKHRKAEAMIAKGSALVIVGESDFQAMTGG